MDKWCKLYAQAAAAIQESVDSRATVEVQLDSTVDYREYISAVHAVLCSTSRYNAVRLGSTVLVEGRTRYEEQFTLQLNLPSYTDHPL